jgi:putative DNA primase/helicase
MRKISDERVGRQSHSTLVVNGATPAIRAALAVAADYPVFPCDAVSKRPLTKHGFNEATQDAAIVTGWWRKYPEALIGVPTGSPSGLVAVDVDPEGKDWFQDHRGRLGDYRLHGTRRGKHLLYRMNGTAIRNSAGVVAEGVDVRGEGGYVIWWPAHGGVAIGEPGELPGWLGELVGKRKLTKLNGSGEEPDGRDQRKFRSGERNDALSRRAHYYRKSGMSTKEIGAALLKYDLEHCEPPYQTTDGKDKVLYIARKKAHLTTDEQDKQAQAAGDVLVSCAPDVRARKWVWEGHIEQGVYHLLSGVPGTNKTCTVLSFAATVTSGGKWPDGTRFETPADVVMWSGEDDIETTLRPRFLVCGGDWRRMHFVSGVRVQGKKRRFSPARDMEALIGECKRIGNVKLVIIDSISNAIVKDSHNDSEVRQQLEPLLDFIEQTGAALFGISHFTKGSRGADPLERIMGSRAMGAVPRGTYSCTKIMDEDSHDTGNRIFTMLKTQFAKEDHGFEYRVEEVVVPKRPQVTGLRLVWGRRVEGSAAQLIGDAEGNGDGESKLGLAKKALTAFLTKGSKNGFEIAELLKKEHISRATYLRARDELRLEKMPAGKHNFRWSLPDSAMEKAPD